MSNSFADVLIHWYEKNKRDLPWRQTTDPYLIWLSEIILQQTRVVQGLPYYQRFTEAFPTIQDLAAADEQEVLRLWQGLGYYSRARNLHSCAKTVVENYNGEFPQTAAELKKLKGIGDYTAAAIASFAFKEAVPVLDGNVFRVIARYYGIVADIAENSTKAIFYQVLNQLIPRERPDTFNQAIMEFGAMHCTPAKPLCLYCELQQDCFAFKNQQQHVLPVKSKKVKVRDRYFTYLVWKGGNTVFMKQRGPADVWQGLYDFDLLESKGDHPETEEVLQKAEEKAGGVIRLLHTSEVMKHVLTHQRIYAVFMVLELSGSATLSVPDLVPYTGKEVEDLPKPRLIDNYVNEILSDYL